ncbi:MAG: hypothetical protein KAI67_04755 [Candidatus Pacebacteria bacterium]|nr:hypothetical protein [Candidatus Paceibacterota bacterium]
MRNVIIPDKITISCNKGIKELPYFSIGEVIDKKIFEPKKEQYKINLNIVKDPKDYFNEELNYFFSNYKIGHNSIYYERSYLKLKCKLYVENLLDDNFKVYINKNYLDFVRVKIDNLYPAGNHLKDILLTKIIASGDLIVHASSLHNLNTNDSFLCIAPPDTGKTYTTLTLLKDKHKYKFLGEDLSYYDGKKDELYCVPFTSTFGQSFDFSAIDLLVKVPMIGALLTKKRKIITDLFGKDCIIKSSKLSRVYVLEKSKEDSLTKTNLQDVIEKIMTIHRNEFSYFKNPLLRAFEYHNNDKINIDNIYYKEKENFIKLLSDKSLYIVKAKSYDNFHEIINRNEDLLK